MVVRVVHCGTGNVGRFALRGLIDHADLELIGLYSVSPDKIGRDASELVGYPKATSIRATCDLDTLIALRPDCVSYFAMGHNRIEAATDDVVKILERGINVVCISHVEMVAGIDGRHTAGNVYERIEAACAKGNSTFLANGIHAGFASDVMPIVLASVCNRIDSVRIQEIAVYDHYVEADGDHTSKYIFGLGMPPEFEPALFNPMSTVERYFGHMVHQIARRLGHTIDGFTTTLEKWVTPTPLETSLGPFKAGEVAAIHWELHGMVDGVPRVTIEHYTRIIEGVAPEWPVLPPAENANEDRYRVIVRGEPTASFIFDAAAEHFGRNREEGGHVVTAMRTLNAIPAVCAANPGIVTTLDLPVYVSGNVPWRQRSTPAVGDSAPTSAKDSLELSI